MSGCLCWHHNDRDEMSFMTRSAVQQKKRIRIGNLQITLAQVISLEESYEAGSDQTPINTMNIH